MMRVFSIILTSMLMLLNVQVTAEPIITASLYEAEENIVLARNASTQIEFNGVPDMLTFDHSVTGTLAQRRVTVQESADGQTWTTAGTSQVANYSLALKPSTRYLKFTNASGTATLANVKVTELKGFRLTKTSLDFGTFQLGHNPESMTFKLTYSKVGTITLTANDAAFTVSPETIDGTTEGETEITVSLEPTTTGDFSGKSLTISSSIEGIDAAEVSLAGICQKMALITINEPKAPLSYYFNTSIEDIVTLENEEKEELLAIMTTSSTNEAVAKMEGNKLNIYDVEGTADITVTFPEQDGWSKATKTFTVTPKKDPKILPVTAFDQETCVRLGGSWNNGMTVGASYPLIGIKGSTTFSFVGMPNILSFRSNRTLTVEESVDGEEWTKTANSSVAANADFSTLLNPLTRYVRLNNDNGFSATVTNLTISELTELVVDVNEGTLDFGGFNLPFKETDVTERTFNVRYPDFDATSVQVSLNEEAAEFFSVEKVSDEDGVATIKVATIFDNSGDFTGTITITTDNANKTVTVTATAKKEPVIEWKKAPYYYNTTVEDFFKITNGEESLLTSVTSDNTEVADIDAETNILTVKDVTGTAHITISFDGDEENGWVGKDFVIDVTPKKDPKILPLGEGIFDQEAFGRLFSGAATWNNGAQVSGTATINFVGVPNKISFHTTGALEIKESADGETYTNLPNASANSDYSAALNPATRYVQVRKTALLGNATITDMLISELNGVAIDAESVTFSTLMAGSTSNPKKVRVRYNNIGEGVDISVAPADDVFQLSMAKVIPAEGEDYGTQELEITMAAPMEWPAEAQGQTRDVTATVTAGEATVALSGTVHKFIDTTEMDAAIENAEENIFNKLGFDVDEYAPYTLPEGIYEAYDAVKDAKKNILSNEVSQESVNEAVSTLNTKISAAVKNTEEMEPFAPQTDFTLPFTYGNERYRTLSLAKETLYTLEFKYSGGAVTVNAKDKDGKKIVDEMKGSAEAESFFGYIGTNESDNFVLTITGDEETTISDVVLKKFDESEIQLDFTPQTLTDGGKFYLYNVITKRFLTHNGLDATTPVLYTFNNNGNSYNLVNGSNGLNITIKPNSGFMGMGGGPEPSEVTVNVLGEASDITIGGSENGYTFSTSESWTYNLGQNATYTAHLSSKVEENDVKLSQTSVPTSYYNKWILVSEEEYDLTPEARENAVADFGAAYERAQRVNGMQAPALMKFNMQLTLASAGTIAARINSLNNPASLGEIRNSTQSMNSICDQIEDISDFYVASLQDISNIEKIAEGTPALSTVIRTLTGAARLGLEVPSKSTMSLAMGALRTSIITSVLLTPGNPIQPNTNLTGLLNNPSFETGDMTGWTGLKIDLNSLSDLLGMFTGGSTGDFDLSKLTEMLNIIGFSETSSPVFQENAHGKYVYQTESGGLINQGQQAAQILLGLPAGQYKFTADMQSIGANTTVGTTAVVISLNKLLESGFDLLSAENIGKILEAIRNGGNDGGEGDQNPLNDIIAQVFQIIFGEGSDFMNFIDIHESEFTYNSEMEAMECNFTCNNTSIVLVLTSGRDTSLIGSIISGISGMLGQLGGLGEVITSIAPYKADNARLEFVDNLVVGIKEHTAVSNKKDVIYDLSGRRVNKTTAPGIYIKNGKKTVKK